MAGPACPATEQLARLSEENLKLRKINAALIERVESGASRSDDSYAAFQHSVVLAEQVRERTEALSQAMLELKASNQLLNDARQRAETAHQHLVDAIESISDAFVLFDAQQRIVLFNSRFKALWAGSQVRVISGMRLAEVKRLMLDTGLFSAADDAGGEGRLLYRLHGERWVQISERPTREGGRVMLFTDITEVKLGETLRREQAVAQNLRERERWVRLITDNVPALIAYLNADLVYEFTNKVYEQWYCWPTGAMLGQRLREVHSEEHYQRLESYIARALCGESVTFEFAETNVNGQERYMLRSYVPNRLANGEVVGIFVLIRDITERRRSAEALHQAYQHLELRVRDRTAELTSLNRQLLGEIEERSRVEVRLREAKQEAERANLSKTKFLAAVSHDLLQPLNAARLFTSALLEQSPAPASLVRNISHSLEDVENLLGTLVDISKLDAGVIKADVAPFALGELLDNLALEFGQLARSEGLRLSYVPSSVLVRSDVQLLARILRNLLSNAIRYTPGGRVLLGCRRVGGCVSIEVWDTGVGIAPDKLEEVFQEFKRGDQQRPNQDRGLGLGLAIVDKIAGILGHKVSLRSQLGRGSVFCVQVPLAKRLARRSTQLVCSEPLLERLHGARIWVLDNDAAICAGMRTLLEGWGCQVITALSEQDLAAQVEQFHADADLLIADYHLDDDANGVDAVAAINARRSSPLPALMITANYSNELKAQMRELGHTLMHKPVRPMKLKTAISHLLG